MNPSFHRTTLIDGHTVKVACRIKSRRVPTYYVVYTRPDGIRKRFPLKTKNAREAEQGLEYYINGAGFRADIRAGIAAAAESRTDDRETSLRKVRAYYVEVYLVNKGGSALMIKNAATDLQEFIDYANAKGITRATHVTRPLVDGFAATLRKRDLAPKTILNKIAVLRAAFHAAVDAEIIADSPIRRWSMPKVPDSEIDPLTLDEVTSMLRIFARNRPDAYPIIAWIALTGNRPSDACDLRFGQVDLKNRLVSRTQLKVKKLAKYDIAPEAAALVAAERLRRRPANDDRVFVHGKGTPRPWTERALWHVVQETLAAAKFRRHVNLKDLRHTFAYHMANDPKVDCKLQKLQVLMGHANIRMTLRYVKPADAKDEVARFGRVMKVASIKADS